jgi:hypothetical protein
VVSVVFEVVMVLLMMMTANGSGEFARHVGGGSAH